METDTEIFKQNNTDQVKDKTTEFQNQFCNKIEVRSNAVFYQLGRLNNTRAQTF